jgi:hypothetical protein
MPALAGQQRPASPAPGSVIGASVIVLAIAVAVVAVPDRTTGRIGLEQRVGHPERIEDQRIVCAAQAETDELEELGADQLVGAHAAIVDAVVNRDDLAKQLGPLQDLRR